MFVASFWCVYYSRRVIDGNWSLQYKTFNEDEDVMEEGIKELDDGYILKGTIFHT